LSTNVVRRTALGFQGGQVLSLRLPEEVLNRLRDTLKEGRERWLEVEAADGAVLVDIGQVVYLRVESDEHRIGF
jgi:urease accessory protein UreE